MPRSPWRPWAALFVLPLLAAEPAGDIPRERVERALPQIEKLARETLAQTGVPGIAIAVVHQDEVVWLKGVGVRRAGGGEEIDADTVFQVASVSKPIATTVLAALVGEKRITWDDPVADHLPGFRLSDPWVTRQVTLRDFLCHRSGLPDHGGDLLEDMGYTQGEIFQRLRHLEPAGAFRASYAYTNFGFTAAAAAGARAAGMSWADLSAAKLYRPLGMTSTSSRFADYARAKNRALLHVPAGGKWLPRYTRDPDAQSPAGGVSTSVRDLAQWLRLQLAGGKHNDRQIVAASALEETHRPMVLTGFSSLSRRPSFYGLGWNVQYDEEGRLFLRHSGAFDLGVRTQVALYPHGRLGIAVLSNAAPTGIPEGITESFFDLVLEGKLRRDWITFTSRMFEQLVQAETAGRTDYSRPPAAKSPPLALSAYAGTYTSSYYGDVEVLEKDGSLQLQVGPKKQTFPLRHWNRDVFVYETAGESATGASGVIFQVGPDGKAARVTIEALDANGQGTFPRANAR